tara:strand:- start:299 stop:508 length:210 start_codon:yes stop_codon:yes gene_type:complete
MTAALIKPEGFAIFFPAIFYVDSDGYEGIVNFRVKNNYIIVERVSAVFTLRHGVDTLCVFNENLKQRSL